MEDIFIPVDKAPAVFHQLLHAQQHWFIVCPTTDTIQGCPILSMLGVVMFALNVSGDGVKWSRIETICTRTGARLSVDVMVIPKENCSFSQMEAALAHLGKTITEVTDIVLIFRDEASKFGLLSFVGTISEGTGKNIATVDPNLN